jgi:hypothetical protein
MEVIFFTNFLKFLGGVMKTGRICKKSVMMDGFSRHEALSVVECLKEVFPGSYTFIKKMQGDTFLLTIVPPAVLTPLALANELFALFNLQPQ